MGLKNNRSEITFLFELLFINSNTRKVYKSASIVAVKMPERIAEIVRTCFADKYQPKEALQQLFSHPYQPEQDHDVDFLVALTDASSIFKNRIRNYFKSLEEGTESNDKPFVELFDRLLRYGKYASFADMLKKYEGYVQEKWSPGWKDDQFYYFLEVGPTKFVASWAVNHECKLSPEESSFLIDITGDFPLSRPGYHQLTKANQNRETIYTKFKAAYPKKFSHVTGERNQRRARAFDTGVLGQKSNVSQEVYSTLHQIDHEFNWVELMLGE